MKQRGHVRTRGKRSSWLLPLSVLAVLASACSTQTPTSGATTTGPVADTAPAVLADSGSPGSGSSDNGSSGTMGSSVSSSSDSGDGMTPADVPVVDPGEQVDVFEIEAGDCFDSLTLDEVTEVNGLSCDAEHLYEVYFAFDIEGETFPGEDTVIENSQEGCLAEFAAFVGIEYEDSFLDISYLYPTPKSWTMGDDREVLCMVVNLDDTPRVGSARGIGS